MQSWLHETVVELGSGRVLVTCDWRSRNEAALRDTRWSYAKYHSDSGAHVDLMPALSLALLPDAKQSNELRESAGGQREVARLQSGKRSCAHYESNARQRPGIGQGIAIDAHEIRFESRSHRTDHIVKAHRIGSRRHNVDDGVNRSMNFLD